MGCGCAADEKKISREPWKYGATERVNKLRDQYWLHKPTIDVERALSYTKTYKANEAEEVCIKRARALYDYMRDRTVNINPNELIVGTYGNQPRAVIMCPEICISWYKDEIDTMATRAQDPYQISEESKKAMREIIFPYWEGRTMEDYYIANLSPESKKVAFGTGVVFGENKSQAGAGEFAPGYGNIILKKGFKGVQMEAEEKLKELDGEDISTFEKRKFYESVIISCQAAKIQSERYAACARKQAETEKDAMRKEELLQIADACERVPYETPRTFREAVQSIWFTQLMIWSEENATSFCIERIDQILYPYYQKDKAAGILTDTDVQEIFDCLWIKMAEMVYAISDASSVYFSGYQPYHGIACGGCKEDGSDASNELSYMVLQATADTRMHAPTINVRVCKNTSDKFMMKICELVELGTGQPAIFFDETAFKILRRNGVKEEDLWNWCVAGCVEPQIPGKMSLWDEGARYSYATAVEWVLFNGLSKILGKRIGLETGDPRNFKTYKEFEEAAEKQLAYMIKAACQSCQVCERAHRLRMPKPVRSILCEGCIETGKDVVNGGALYTFGPGIESTGIADLADSMAAIKKLVYEDKKLTMDELIKAVEADFEGYEDIRQMLINDAPKYGNDLEYVDSIAQHFVDISCDDCEQYTGLNGSKFMNGNVPAISNIPHGAATWALPSGRKATLPLADGISPFPGYDHKGPSAVVKSITSLDHVKNGVGTLLNIKLSPSLIASEGDKKNLIALLRAEGELGGYHVQFNVVSTEKLRDAQEHPENYGDLLVRIAGYSAYFIELRREAQESIIARTENKGW